MVIREKDIKRLVKECVNKLSGIIKESASKLLYHFVNFDAFKNIVVTNEFTPSDREQNFNGENNSFMSFSRTKSFRHGYPALKYSEYGDSDTWCAIRLTIDGDLMNEKPNFKVDGKQHNMKIKPFDWVYNEYTKSGYPINKEHDIDMDKDVKNGKEWMMNSSSDYITNMPKKFSKYDDEEYESDRYGQPYSQAEDRLVTSANKIPNASEFIKRVDILLMDEYFNRENKKDRKTLKKIMDTTEIGSKIHLYTSLMDLEHDYNEFDSNYLI